MTHTHVIGYNLVVLVACVRPIIFVTSSVMRNFENVYVISHLARGDIDVEHTCRVPQFRVLREEVDNRLLADDFTPGKLEVTLKAH